MSFPDFSLITFVAPGKRAKELPNAEKINLYKFFEAIVNKQALEVDEYQLSDIFVKDLGINTKKFDKVLVGVLAEALIYFMTQWPGWEKSNDYYAGKILCKEWYEKFKNYLIIKSTFIVNKALNFSKKRVLNRRNAEVQTELYDQSLNRRVAPYELCIGGTPNVLNNLVFVEMGENIVIKRHAEKAWPILHIQEFINWPHVKLEVQLPDISITRTNTHQMSRYLTFYSDATTFQDTDTIKYIKKLPAQENMELTPYSFEFFSEYFKQLKKTLVPLPGVLTDRLVELEVILREFLADIKEVNLYDTTMCPYISIAYHIGKCKYLRNKRVNPGKKGKPPINFLEMIVPEVQFSLNYFKVVQDTADIQNITFESLNKLYKKIKDAPNSAEVISLRNHLNNTFIKYSCTLCNAEFSDFDAYRKLNNHFEIYHKCEQPLLCHKCLKTFHVQYLTSKRWHHECVN